ncbi:hypothetical protein EZS27_030772, partial [termite gut metagenome]
EVDKNKPITVYAEGEGLGFKS